MKKFYLISLGCAKNTVDSQSIAALMNQSGFQFSPEIDQVDVILVNTCGFIGAARQETLEVLSEIAEKKNKRQHLVAAGCMAELFESQIREAVPGVDLIVGSQRWEQLPQLINKQLSPKGYKARFDLPSVPRVAIQGASAYLEISNGCRRQCSYCSIPLIKGTLRSRTKEEILLDARYLQENHIKEIMVIGQDTSDFGNDRNDGYKLPHLIEDLLLVTPDVPWIRLLYSFPGVVTEQFLSLMKDNQRILNYLDIPLQHADKTILRSMNRPSNINQTRDDLLRIREEIPGIALRTTFIVGYPGEGEKEYQTLLDFIEEIRFDRVGVFPFSYEPNTPSAPLGDPIPEEIKLQRVDKLMRSQQQISLEINQSFVGKQLEVLIEGVDEKEKISVGRTYRDAPEIDGLVFVNGLFPVGTMINVNITEGLEYDLIGEAASDSTA
jgi:ribosomal protein S12 methylthiotransferase